MYWYVCPECRCVWRRIAYGKYEICPDLPRVGLEKRYCRKCLKKIDNKYKDVLEKIWRRKETDQEIPLACPRCGNAGIWDKNGYKVAKSDKSVWWNFERRRFECIECFLTEDCEIHSGAA